MSDVCLLIICLNIDYLSSICVLLYFLNVFIQPSNAAICMHNQENKFTKFKLKLTYSGLFLPN